MNFLVKFLVPWGFKTKGITVILDLLRAWGWWLRVLLVFLYVAYSFVPFSTISIVPQWLCCIVSKGFFLTPDEVLGLVTLHAHSVKPPAA